MPTKRLRAWFTSLVGDTPINGFYQRFVGGGQSKPTENSFKDLFESVAFHTEISSASQTDSVGALQNKQGLSIKAGIPSAQAGSDTALGSTGGTLFCSPSHLPNVIPSVTNQTIREFNNNTLTVVVDQTGSNNKYSANINADLITVFNKYLLPTFTAPDAEKIVALNVGGTAYELITAPSGGTGGSSYSGTSASGNTIAKGAKTFAITPDAGTFKVAVGTRIRFADSVDTTRFVEGQATASSSSSITIDADNILGTGSLTTTIYNLGGGIPSSDTTGVPNLFVSSLGGSDSTGDGSILKPFATIAYAQSLVINNQTIIVFGGSYTNSINLVKAGITFTLFCFPGVTITQTGTSLINSLAVSGRVDIVGEPNINCPSLAVACFIINEVSVSKLGKIVSIYKFADLYTKLYKLDGVTAENTIFTFREASWESTSVPAIKLMRSGLNPQGTILLNIGSLEFTVGVPGTNANYIEINDPYTVAITGNLQYRGSATLTTPTLIKLTSTSFSEVSINKLTCRMGGITTNPTFLDLGANNITNKYFFVKDVQMSVVPSTFVTASTASSLYAENVYLVNGSTVQGGSATIKTMAPAVTNTRTFVGTDVFMAALFNL